MKIYPSIIAADILNLDSVVRELERVADGLHLDIMDNHFVQNLTFGAQFVNAIRKITKSSLDVHLMVDDPFFWVDKLDLFPKDFFTFHFEAVKPELLPELITMIVESGCQVGMAVKPAADLADFAGFLSDLDRILIMSVEPGFSGQKFLNDSLSKIRAVAGEIKKNSYKCDLAVDGGINFANIKLVKEAGADSVAVGTTLFVSGKPSENIAKLKEIAAQ